ncbi:hypothetical protein FSP39_019129 [Pinctada imbricata]|uniref:P2X purinoreceptor 7 intracellular domain-containing protein n=1 Tax=Pinctada imbricata TaxID=66713 RepID=A0AA88Y0T7_PINIB|nr:hypothetical protein FSP39_019129 [Pinctada imbricata]
MEFKHVDVEMEFRVAPYQFEPTRSTRGETDDSGTDSSESSSDDDAELRPVEEWCSCGHCENMPTDRENVCCKQFPLCMEKMEPNTLKCVTHHEAFRVNCLNTDVLELAFYDYLDIHGHIGDEEPVHELYRHIGYRRFVRWIWHRLGKRNRKVLPSCVVNSIRQAFPSQEYCGFKYPRDY